MKKRLLILGVTASGKARLAFELGRKTDAEIISVDSMKIYRRMDIGTAKASPAAQAQVPYHLVDVVEPSESFSVGTFYAQAQRAVEDIEQRGKRVVAVGGTALYIKALLYGLFEGPGADEALRLRLKSRVQREGLPPLHRELQAIDPAAARRINPNDERRIVRALEVYLLTGKPISSFQTQFEAIAPAASWQLIGLRRSKEHESRRINARVKRMVDAGLVTEVQSLLAEPLPLSKQAAAAIGYAEIIAHLRQETDLGEAVERIKVNTRRLAKHQRTWFKTFAQVRWFDLESDAPVEPLIDPILEAWQEQ
jgi:tRNA dimethylallyltransferase